MVMWLSRILKDPLDLQDILGRHVGQVIRGGNRGHNFIIVGSDFYYLTFNIIPIA